MPRGAARIVTTVIKVVQAGDVSAKAAKSITLVIISPAFCKNYGRKKNAKQ